MMFSDTMCTWVHLDISKCMMIVCILSIRVCSMIVGSLFLEKYWLQFSFIIFILFQSIVQNINSPFNIWKFIFVKTWKLAFTWNFMTIKIFLESIKRHRQNFFFFWNHIYFVKQNLIFLFQFFVLNLQQIIHFLKFFKKIASSFIVKSLSSREVLSDTLVGSSPRAIKHTLALFTSSPELLSESSSHMAFVAFFFGTLLELVALRVGHFAIRCPASHFESMDQLLPSFFSLFFATLFLSLIHIWRCRRSTLCRSRWSPYH